MTEALLVDQPHRTEHNQLVLRRVLFAALLLLCLFARVTSDRVVACTPDDTGAAARAAASQAEDSTDPEGADQRWAAWHPSTVSPTASAWHSLLQYAELPGGSRLDPFSRLNGRDVSKRSPASQSPHLHDIPLLI
jgi:hypothetical protein